MSFFKAPQTTFSNIVIKTPKPSTAESRKHRLDAAGLKEMQNCRDHFAREFKYSKKSIARGWADWQKLCADLTDERFKVETQVLIHGVNRSIDKADHVLDMIKRDRNNAEEMYRRNVNRHTDLLNVIYGKSF